MPLARRGGTLARRSRNGGSDRNREGGGGWEKKDCELQLIATIRLSPLPDRTPEERNTEHTSPLFSKALCSGSSSAQTMVRNQSISYFSVIREVDTYI